MAETAAILCPGKTILSPEPQATCPMANSISADLIRSYREQHPGSLVLSYVNTPAAVKAESDVCCTSSNAEKILRRLPLDREVYFIPDQNLALNVSSKLGRKVEAFASHCPIHAQLTPGDISELKKTYPEAKVLVHPECSPEVIELADFVGSTGGIIEYARGSEPGDFIIATEGGILHAIRKHNPEHRLIMASEDMICPNMKSITLEKIRYSIKNHQTVIEVKEPLRSRAVLALEKMIELAS